MPTGQYDDILLLKFLNYFSQNASERTWTSKLPGLVSAKNAAAMKTAARAVSLAFAAETLQDPSMARAACEYYGSSLRYHQASFKAPAGKAICRKKAVNALPVTILLSYFEMIQATSADAWLEHTLAAERLFVLLGPSALEDELLNHLYFIVRSSSAIRCFLLGTNTQLMEPGWSDMPMSLPCGSGSTIFNSLVDLIMWLSKSVNMSTDAAPPSMITYDLWILNRTLSELRRLWVVFGDIIGLDTDAHHLFVSDVNAASSLSEDTSTKHTVSSLPEALHQSSAALTCAFFHAAGILLLTLLTRRKLTLLSSQLREYQQTPSKGVVGANLEGTTYSVLHHSKQVLALAEYLRTQRVGCACLRMILPLAVVHRLIPCQHQRSMAETIFKDWSTSDGLAGLTAFAFIEKDRRPGAVIMRETM